jgi:hypothetical protein
MSDSAFSCLMPSDFSGWPDNYRKRDFAQNPSTSDMAILRQPSQDNPVKAVFDTLRPLQTPVLTTARRLG